MVILPIEAAFLLMCQQVVCATFRIDYFEKVVVEERADILWNVDNVSSKLKCTTRCLADSRCATFGFVEANGSCSAFGPGARKAIGKHGSSTYYSKRQSGGMYQPCVNKDQCHINGAVCFKGTCLCTPGLSYHKAEQACVRNCSRYGKTLSVYEGLGIVGHNTVEKEHILPQMCIYTCTTTTAFECLSVDIKPTAFYCSLSSYGYLDVSESDRETEENGWLFGTRDCAFD